MADILYFASLAETLGLKSEVLELPDECKTATDLAALLRTRGEPFASAFDGKTRLLIAINQEMCDPGDEISNADEIAFFPPVTGG
jgi:molybdopterin synthase sulfur carrier subunit